MLRIVYISEVFQPLKLFLGCILKNKLQYETDNMLNMLGLIFALGLSGHILACIWIALGIQYEDGWLNVLKAENYDNADVYSRYGARDYYSVSLYWILNSVFLDISYLKGRKVTSFAGREFFFTMCLQFAWILFFSISIGLIQNFVQVSTDWYSVQSSRVHDLNAWAVKVEKARNDETSLEFLPPHLYRDMTEDMEEIVHFDHNLLIRQFAFYHQLMPKDQTRLINFTFSGFRRTFRSFFDQCE